MTTAAEIDVPPPPAAAGRAGVRPLAARNHPAPAIVAVAVAGLFFVAVAPTLAWLDFSSGSENLAVESVLEMRRGGPWGVPTLQLQPRTQKPPLAAWVSG